MRHLERLIQDRMAELDLSYRRAAVKSGGLVSAANLNRHGKGWGMTPDPRTMKGIALALAVPVEQVERAVEKDRATARKPVRQLPPSAEKLTAKGWSALLRTLDFLLEQQDPKRRRA